MKLYEKLGLKKGASKKGIKRAFRYKAKQMHPDKATNKTNEFIEIKNAYEILIDDNRRNYYDIHGRDKKKSSESEIQGKVISLLMRIIQSRNFRPESTDFFAMAILEIERDIYKTRQEIEIFNRQIDKLLATEKRIINGDLIKSALKDHSEEFKRNIVFNEEKIKECEEMIKLLESFEYEDLESEYGGGTISFNTFIRGQY